MPEALDDRDLDQFIQYIADDAVAILPGKDERLVGRDEIRRHMETMLARMKEGGARTTVWTHVGGLSAHPG